MFHIQPKTGHCSRTPLHSSIMHKAPPATSKMMTGRSHLKAVVDPLRVPDCISSTNRPYVRALVQYAASMQLRKETVTEGKDFPYVYISDLISDDPNDETGQLKLQWVQLVLASAGVLGIAYIGFVWMLEAAGVRFLGLGGTSAGAIVASVIASARERPDLPCSQSVFAILQGTDFKTFWDAQGLLSSYRQAIVSKDKHSVTDLLPLWPIWTSLGLVPGQEFANWLADKQTRQSASSPIQPRPPVLVHSWKQLLQRMRLKHTDEESSSSRAADADADAVSSSQMAASNTSSDVNGAGSGTASTNLVAVSNEASSSSSSSGGTMHSKQLADIKVYEWDGVHWDESTMKDKTGYLDARMQERDHFPLRLVATELTTQSMVVFPRDADLFFAALGDSDEKAKAHADEVDPAEFVLASSSIPLVFTPFTKQLGGEEMVQQQRYSLAWQDRLMYDGPVPQQVVLADGAILSNFPMHVFGDESDGDDDDAAADAAPLMPIIGVDVETRVARSTAQPIDSLEQLLQALTSTTMHLNDRSYINNHPIYRDSMVSIGASDFNMLEFKLTPEQKEKLLIRGMEEARRLLERWRQSNREETPTGKVGPNCWERFKLMHQKSKKAKLMAANSEGVALVV